MSEMWIVGVSFRLPESDSPAEFFQKVGAKESLVTLDARRWTPRPDEPNRFGKIKQHLGAFDAQFFSVHPKQAERLDPQIRLLLEVSYEAFVDAGLSLSELKGSRTGVYIGACNSDALDAWTRKREEISGYEIVGCAGSMLSNRLSFFYDLKGPSEAIDTACSSSLVALHRAVSDLEAGVCDHAIVGGASIILAPTTTYAYTKLKMLSPDGICQSFDQKANGFARAEGIVAVVLTRHNPLYRPYAKILGSGVNNSGWGAAGITFPSSEAQKRLYRSVCDKAGIDPASVDYVEAHGTGTVAGDGEELSALYDVYGQANPSLRIGSVKSNIGHCEGAAGLAGLAKTLLSLDQETLLPNLHFNQPHEKVRTMRVATEPVTGWKGKRAGISSFGFGGTNAHLLIEKVEQQGERIPKPLGPTLLAHRTKEGLYQLKKQLLEDPSIPPPFPLNYDDKQKLPFREVLELPDDAALEPVAEADDAIYLVCSGNGGQWQGMGLDLCRAFPSFRTTLEACGEAIGVDLLQVLETGFHDAKGALVALVGLQIALIELLKTIGLEERQFAGFVGHSTGEIVCSYLDRLTSLQETMRIAAARGSLADPARSGLMASIGLSKEEAEEFIREEIGRVCVACVNSPRNVTLSGDKEAIVRLVAAAEKRDLFCRVLETYGQGYHSPLFASRRPEIEKRIDDAMSGVKKTRSSKWRSAVAGMTGDSFDASYHVASVISPVDFLGAIQTLPPRAKVLEIGPHPLLRTPILDSRPDLKYVAFCKKGQNGVDTFNAGLAQFWKYGGNLDLKRYYRLEKSAAAYFERPPLALRHRLSSWNHTEILPVPQESDFSGSTAREEKVIYDLGSDTHQFLKGHVINGKLILPATSYLSAMWSVFRAERNLSWIDPVVYLFTDFQILQAVQAEDDSRVELGVRSLGQQYELLFKDEVVARVKIRLTEKGKDPEGLENLAAEGPPIDATHFYRIARNLGYDYSGSFQVIETLHARLEKNCNAALLRWEEGNWIAFLDGMLQTLLLSPREEPEPHRVPVRIESISIDPLQFFQGANSTPSNKRPALADFALSTVYAPGIALSGLELKRLHHKRPEKARLVHIKAASTVLYYGATTFDNEEVNDYSVMIASYAVEQCRNLIEEKKCGDRGHYRKILEAFDRWGQYQPVNQAHIARYKTHPEGIALRMLIDMYTNRREEFFTDPLVTVTQHPEHDELYARDILTSVHDKSAILKLLSVVRDNRPNPELTILEIGTGTGGFTRLIAPYLVNDRYIATDIHKNLQIAPDKRPASLDLRYRTFHLDQPEHYKLLSEEPIDLVIASHSLHTGMNIDRSLAALYERLADGAFVILYETHSTYPLAMMGMDARLWDFEDKRDMGLWICQKAWLDKLAERGFEVISYIADKCNSTTLFFVRKPLKLSLKPVAAPSIDRFESWHPEIARIQEPTLLVASQLEQSGVSGLVRTLNREVEARNFHCLIGERPLQQETLRQIERFGLQVNIEREGRLGTECDVDIAYEPLPRRDTGYWANFTTVGDFSSYRWVNHPEPKHKQFQALYGTINFKDVMLLSGKIGIESFVGIAKEAGPSGSVARSYVGLEFSGRDEKGGRFMGTHLCGLTNRIDTMEEMILPIPDGMSDEEAVTIPVTYATAYLALAEKARIEPGQTLLIHSGAGGVGQAAIHIGLSLGCPIFTTCQPAKKEALLKLFPQLDPERVLNSRTTEFAGQILKMTGGKGVDIVLNSLSDDKLHASLRCTAQGGHFVEIGKYDTMNHTAIDMHRLIEGISIHGVHLNLELTRPDRAKKLLANVAKGLKTGAVKPLSRHVFSFRHIDEALRFLGSGKNIGKVLIDFSEMPAQPEPSKVVFYPTRDQTGYSLITGGLGGFGLSLIEWLFERGERKFLITSRQGISSGEQERLIAQLRAKGAHIIVSTHNVASEKEARALVESVQGQISAVYHLGMVLDDATFKNMTREKWERAVGVKARGAIHLDRLTRLPSVKRFLAFSSFVSRSGSVGQSNYAFGNGVMEEVCRRRRQEGFHAVAIQWGVIDNVGFVANNPDLSKGVTVFKAPVPIGSALDFIDQLLVHQINSHCVQYSAEERKILEGEQIEYTPETVFNEIYNVTKIDLLRVNGTTTLEYLGIDSLQVVEIQTILVKAFREVLPLKKISGMKIAELRKLIEEKFHKGEEKQPLAPPTPASQPPLPLLKPLSQEGRKEALFLFLGLGVREEALTLPDREKFDLYLVQWENSHALQPLAEAIDIAIEKGRYQRALFFTHSAGYHIAKGVLHLGRSKIDRIASVSLIHEKTILKVLEIKDLEKITDLELESAYRHWAFYVEKHLPLPKVKRQLLLLKQAVKHPYIPPDLLFHPEHDPLADRTKQGIAIAGGHQMGAFPMEEVYARLV